MYNYINYIINDISLKTIGGLQILSRLKTRSPQVELFSAEDHDQEILRISY